MRELVCKQMKEELFDHLDCRLCQLDGDWLNDLSNEITETLLWKYFIDALKYCQANRNFPQINSYKKYKLFAGFLLEVLRKWKS